MKDCVYYIRMRDVKESMCLFTLTERVEGLKWQGTTGIMRLNFKLLVIT